MFGLGFWEIALILVVALLVFGPAKLPELARSLGRGLREFRKATDEFKSTIDTELHAPEPKRDRPVPDPAGPATLPETVARTAPFGVQPETEAEIEDNDFGDEEAVASSAEGAAKASAAADHAASADTDSDSADASPEEEVEPAASPEPSEITDTRNKA